MRKYYLDILLSLTIVLIPFIGYFHTFFDLNTDLVNGLGISVEKNGMNDTFLIWLSLNRGMALLISVIWYLNCKQRWRSFILIPSGLLLYSIIKNLLITWGEYQDYKHYILGISLISVFSMLLADRYLFGNSNYSMITFNYGIKNFYKQSRQQLDIDRTRYAMTPFAYLKRLVYQQKIIEEQLKDSCDLNEKRINYTIALLLLVGLSFLLIIGELTIPFLSQIDNKQQFINSFGFDASEGFLLYITTKLFVIGICITWYFTTKVWWRYALFSPIVIFSYQLFMGLQTELVQLDVQEYRDVLPSILLLILVLIGFSQVVKYQYKLKAIHNGILAEIQEFLSNIEVDNILHKRYLSGFDQLKDKIKNEKSRSNNLSSLIQLREELERRIDQVQ